MIHSAKTIIWTFWDFMPIGTYNIGFSVADTKSGNVSTTSAAERISK